VSIPEFEPLQRTLFSDFKVDRADRLHRRRRHLPHLRHRPQLPLGLHLPRRRRRRQVVARLHRHRLLGRILHRRRASQELLRLRLLLQPRPTYFDFPEKPGTRNPVREVVVIVAFVGAEAVVIVVVVAFVVVGSRRSLTLKRLHSNLHRS